MDFPLSGPQRSPRKASFAFVDADLRFLTDNVDIRKQLCVEIDSLVGRSVTEILPELKGREDRIEQLIHDPSDCIIHRPVHRQFQDNIDLYSIIQITSARDYGNELVLTVIDVTQETNISQRLQEIKSIPPLKTTAEEIRQNLVALEQWNSALFLLNQAGQVMTATLESQQVLEQLLQVAIELIGAKGGSVWLWDEEQADYLVCEAAYYTGYTPPILDQKLPMGKGIAGWVAQTGKSASVISADNDERFFPGIDEMTGIVTESLLVIPLRIRDEIMGVLEVVNKLEGDFDQNDLAIAETLASSASIAIDNARLVEALQKQAGDLRSRNEELDAFAHTVAHDLQNPLSQLIGFAGVLDVPVEQLSDEVRETAIQVISDNAKKMSTIIRELLFLSGVRKTEVEVAPLHMRGIVESALARVNHLVEEHRAETYLPDEWPISLGYAPWIEEVWENYLSNALKYGGRPPRVELGATIEPDGMVRYWVRDNGPGISPEDQSRLFTPFTTLGLSGYGLGLSIVRRIALKMGGKAEVDSVVGEGSTFSFTLPAAKQSGKD
jgi:signal transduction histidine kinase